MVKQYPYQLQALSVIDNGQDENGNSLPPSESWVDVCSCRDEANTGGRQVSAADGTLFTFSALIQLPKGTEALSAGSHIRVLDGTGIRLSGKVLYSRKDQMHSRAWV